MKIGILTHQYINNYGAFLQAWALREAIAELFPNDEVQIIDYVNLKHFIINAGGWFRFYKNRESFKDWMEKIKLPRTFAKARNQEMILSKRCFNAKQINALDFDCIIVGSDEVWNYKDTKGNAALKFGEGLTCKNLIAYAPSVGKTAADECVPEYVIRGIKKFKKISARDDLTEQLVCNITGTAPERVLDPTFLAEFPRAELAAKKKPYILFYYCENLPHNILNQIFSYAKEHPAIISWELFDEISALREAEQAVKEERKNWCRQRRKNNPNIFKGRIFCKKCGEKLVCHWQRDGTLYFYCASCHVSISEKDLWNGINKELHQRMEEHRDLQKLVRKSSGKSKLQLKEIATKREIEQASGNIVRLESQKRSGYEQYVLGKISKEKFLELKQDAENEIEAFRQTKAENEKELVVIQEEL